MDYNEVFNALSEFSVIAYGSEILYDVIQQDNVFIITFLNNEKNFSVKLNVDKNGSIKVEPKDDKRVYDIHLTNVLKHQQYSNVNDIFDIIPYAFTILPHITNYCIICGEALPVQSDEHITCGNIECEYDSEELQIGDYVVDKVRENNNVASFIIQNAFNAINSTRRNDIFEPFPMYFLKGATKESIKVKRGELSKLTGTQFNEHKDFDKILGIIKNINIQQLIDTITDCPSDEILVGKIGLQTYILIRFILKSCKMTLHEENLVNYSDKNFHQYKIIYDVGIENNFKLRNNGTVCYLYHGSGIDNWYSILRNGIKSMSNTSMMTTGAAYGIGVYTSDSFDLSVGYCGRWGSYSNGNYIMGICEVKGNKTDYRKSCNIFVIPNTDDFLLRYIITFTSNIQHKISRELNLIFNEKLHEIKEERKTRIAKKGTMKLNKEYGLLLKNQELVEKKLMGFDVETDEKINDLGFIVELKNDDLYTWRVLITRFEGDYPIIHDMKKYGINNIELEIRFPDNYPFEPPFIWVISPRFKFRTGHVTINGSICLQLLTNQGWSAAAHIENVLVQIKSLLTEGEGRIDNEKLHIPYDYRQARDDFVRVAASHGWK